MTTHYDQWHGALHTLSVLTRQKTIKYACGKRGPFSAVIDRGVCECIECREHIADAVRFALSLASQPYGTEAERTSLRDAALAIANQFEVDL